MGSGRAGDEWNVQVQTALRTVVALSLATGACFSRQVTGPNQTLEGPGLAAVLNQVDAAATAAQPTTEDAGTDSADAQSARGCVDGSVCPTGTVLFMATYSVPCEDRAIACRRLAPRVPAKTRGPPSVDDVWGDVIWLSGDVARADVDAIVAVVARVDTLPLVSIHQRDGFADVMTGCRQACVVGSGWDYVLRKVKGTWIIEDRWLWIE